MTNCTKGVVKPLFNFYSVSIDNGENRVNYKKGDVSDAHAEVLNYLNAQQLPGTFSFLYLHQ